MVFSCGAEAPVGLAAGDLDRENCRDLGVLGVCLGTEGFDECVLVEHRAVALDVGGLEQGTFDNLVAAFAGAVLDAVLDRLGLICQVFDLSQQGTQCVY